jgi:hypothetical protein
VLITDIDPDRRVKDAMNEINASKRLKYAVAERAEGDKILQVKSAEAEAEAKYLSGVGVAKQRKAIVDVRDRVIVCFVVFFAHILCIDRGCARVSWIFKARWPVRARRK